MKLDVVLYESMTIELASLVKKPSSIERLISFNNEYCKNLILESSFIDKCIDVFVTDEDLEYTSNSATNYVEIVCEIAKFSLSESVNTDLLSNEEVLRILEQSGKIGLVIDVIGYTHISTQACGSYRKTINCTPANLLGRYIEICSDQIISRSATINFAEYTVQRPEEINLEKIEPEELSKAVKNVVKYAIPNCETMSPELAVEILNHTRCITPLVRIQIANDREITAMLYGRDK